MFKNTTCCSFKMDLFCSVECETHDSPSAEEKQEITLNLGR